jgi:hypothetical protein
LCKRRSGGRRRRGRGGGARVRARDSVSDKELATGGRNARAAGRGGQWREGDSSTKLVRAYYCCSSFIPCDCTMARAGQPPRKDDAK